MSLKKYNTKNTYKTHLGTYIVNYLMLCPPWVGTYSFSKTYIYIH